jgi:hypothetical protein
MTPFEGATDSMFVGWYQMNEMYLVQWCTRMSEKLWHTCGLAANNKPGQELFERWRWTANDKEPP